MSEIPFKKMNAFLAPIDIGLIKSFFFNLLNFLDILFMLLYDEIDCYDAPKSGAIVDHYCRPYKNNGAEAPKVPRPIVFKELRDTRTFSNLKSTHCFINY
jgi:hypothetical protein